MRKLAIAIVSTGLIVSSPFSAATTDRVTKEVGAGPYTYKRTDVYTPSRESFDNSVNQRSQDLQQQPNGGSHWFNRKDQPTKSSKTTHNWGVSKGPFRYSKTYERTPEMESADEAALDKVR